MSLTGSSVLSAIAWLHQQPLSRAEVDYGHSEHQEHRQEQHRKIFVLPSRVHVLRGGRGRPSLSVSRQSGGFRNCHVLVEHKAITLMRYIRKALEDHTFVKC